MNVFFFYIFFNVGFKDGILWVFPLNHIRTHTHESITKSASKNVIKGTRFFVVVVVVDDDVGFYQLQYFPFIFEKKKKIEICTLCRGQRGRIAAAGRERKVLEHRLLNTEKKGRGRGKAESIAM